MIEDDNFEDSMNVIETPITFCCENCGEVTEKIIRIESDGVINYEVLDE